MRMSTLRRIHHSIELYLFGNGSSLLVKFLEFIAVAGCPWCSAVRALLIGYGVGRFDLLGLLIIIVAICLTHLEHKINADT